MPYNVPTITTNDISFGPAVLFLGPSGTTPSTDVGAISEDGVAIEMTSEKKVITQGNPKLNVYTFTQAQSVMIKFTSIEWDFQNMARALGAGATNTAGSALKWGGDPLVEQLALHIRHYMAVTGNTMNVYAWKVASDAGVSPTFGADEHSFEYAFYCLRSTTDWAGGALAETQQLVYFNRET